MSPQQLTLDCFRSPFEQNLNPSNRWVVLAKLIPWDAFNEGSHMMAYVEQYHKRFGCYPRELLVDQTGYGLNRIKARLKETSEPWIACIFLVLNLVKLAGAALPRLIPKFTLSFSAWMNLYWLLGYVAHNMSSIPDGVIILKNRSVNIKISA